MFVSISSLFQYFLTYTNVLNVNVLYKDLRSGADPISFLAYLLHTEKHHLLQNDLA